MDRVMNRITIDNQALALNNFNYQLSIINYPLFKFLLPEKNIGL